MLTDGSPFSKKNLRQTSFSYRFRPSVLQRRIQSRSQSFVPLDQRSENVSSGSNHYERTKEITEFWLSGSLRICIYGACLKWLLPELSFSDRWSRGTKLWERDCAVSVLKTLLYLSAHAQMNSTRAHFNMSAREICAILDSLLLGVVVV